MLAALKDRLGRIREDSAVKVVVLKSDGPVFSSGHDLREMVGSDEESYTCIFAECTEVMEAIRLLPQPVIAQVQGLATAAGCQLAATCDLAVASEDAGFCTPGVQIGLFCSTPAVALSRAVSPKHAMEMLLTGIPISAKTAQDWGLVNRVVPSDQLEDTVMQLARHIAKASAYTPGHRQAGILPPASGRPAPGLRNGPAHHGGKPAGPRCARGHYRLPGKAGTRMEKLEIKS